MKKAFLIFLTAFALLSSLVMVDVQAADSNERQKQQIIKMIMFATDVYHKLLSEGAECDA